MSHLGRAHFEEWPVWSEYYEPCELDDLQAWGIEPETFLAELHALDLGDEHAAYPSLIFDPLPERMRLYIKAVFTTARGDRLHGFVVNDDAYAGAIFLDNDELGFNIRLFDFYSDMLVTLSSRLASTVQDLLPIRYETGVHTSEGHEVTGMLSLRAPPPN
jgi:hypothetical protein